MSGFWSTAGPVLASTITGGLALFGVWRTNANAFKRMKEEQDAERVAERARRLHDMKAEIYGPLVVAVYDAMSFATFLASKTPEEFDRQLPFHCLGREIAKAEVIAPVSVLDAFARVQTELIKFKGRLGPLYLEAVLLRAKADAYRDTAAAQLARLEEIDKQIRFLTLEGADGAKIERALAEARERRAHMDQQNSSFLEMSQRSDTAFGVVRDAANQGIGAIVDLSLEAVDSVRLELGLSKQSQVLKDLAQVQRNDLQNAFSQTKAAAERVVAEALRER